LDKAMSNEEAEQWQKLATSIATLKGANEASRADVSRSGYDEQKTLNQLAEESQKFDDCAARVIEALRTYSALTWWVRRNAVGKHCRETFTWFDRSTDDNFGWTKHAQAIRQARDEVDRCLKRLGF
jgi:hypothetical protein